MDGEHRDSDLEKIADGIAAKISQKKVVSIEEGKAKKTKPSKGKAASSNPEPSNPEPNNPPTAKTPDKPPRGTAGAYEVSHDGRLFHNKPVGPNLFEPKLLANFDARIKAEILVDDGAEQRRELEISVTLCTGKTLPTFNIPSSKFPGMGWVVDKCGSAAVLNAGQTVKDHTRCAIQLLSNGDMEQRTVYEHSGWRRIDDKWFNLFNGGAIGADGIETQHAVQLPGTLRDYVLHRPADPAAAIRAALNVLDVAPPEVAIPAFLAPWRALLGEALPVDFSLFLQGPTGVRKTEVAAIIQAHWGAAWHGKHLPAAWSSTANSLERLAFQTKDAVMVVDDFAPNGSATDISRAHSNADRLLRAQGNRAGRGRMNADGSMRPEYFPRGLIVATGEDVLRGQSARGRTLVLEFEPQTVNLSILSELQVAAGQGLLAGAAGAFCQWLATRMDALKADLPGRRIDLRNAISAKNASHSRHPDTLASLQITAEVFAEFAADHGVILDSGWLEHIEAGLRAAGDTQAQFQATEEPAARFVRLIHAALASGRCHVYPLDGKKPSPSEDMTAKGWQLRTFGNEFNARQDWYECGPRIGWFEHDNLYLDPEAAYATVQEFAHHQGQPIPVGQRTLYKALNQKGFIISKDPDGKRLTTKKLLPDGKRPRFLHIGGVGYKKSGASGASGASNEQQSDIKENNQCPTSCFSTTPSGASGAQEFSQDSSRCPTSEGVPHKENREWDRKSADNSLSELDKTEQRPNCPTCPTFSDNPPPVFSASASSSPLATRILATLQGCPAGMTQEDLARMVGNGKGASLAMIETVLARLMMDGRIGKTNGRLVVNP